MSVSPRLLARPIRLSAVAAAKGFKMCPWFDRHTVVHPAGHKLAGRLDREAVDAAMAPYVATGNADDLMMWDIESLGGNLTDGVCLTDSLDGEMFRAGNAWTIRTARRLYPAPKHFLYGHCDGCSPNLRDINNPGGSMGHELANDTLDESLELEVAEREAFMRPVYDQLDGHCFCAYVGGTYERRMPEHAALCKHRVTCIRQIDVDAPIIAVIWNRDFETEMLLPGADLKAMIANVVAAGVDSVCIWSAEDLRANLACSATLPVDDNPIGDWYWQRQYRTLYLTEDLALLKNNPMFPNAVAGQDEKWIAVKPHLMKLADVRITGMMQLVCNAQGFSGNRTTA